VCDHRKDWSSIKIWKVPCIYIVHLLGGASINGLSELYTMLACERNIRFTKTSKDGREYKAAALYYLWEQDDRLIPSVHMRNWILDCLADVVAPSDFAIWSNRESALIPTSWTSDQLHAWGEKSFIRVATNSSASGKPSKRAHICVTASALSQVRAKSGRTVRARLQKERDCCKLRKLFIRRAFVKSSGNARGAT